MICRVCYYRIHDGQSVAWMRRETGWVPVHVSHEKEGKIFLREVRYNKQDEVVEIRAEWR